ncbi:hypothetical protein WY02_03685 [Pseudonocardia sp. AL041005-10]|nr:hypothetical protein [Pseudonocardia sp. AL041005-10]ALE77697.1 hypothetical protein WY02_03685 [Pseudonocardia sp. AL041005-10]
MPREFVEPNGVRHRDSEPGLTVAAAALAVLAVLVGGVLAATPPDTTAPTEPDSAWRTDYDRGWAWLVESQRREPRPDELARAECRFWADGDGRTFVEQRAAFVAGCDTAARMTPLEAP